MTAILLTKSRARVIAAGLMVSVLGSVLGIYFSLSFDFPAGSSVVAVLGFLFMLAAIVRLSALRSEGSFLSRKA